MAGQTSGGGRGSKKFAVNLATLMQDEKSRVTITVTEPKNPEKFIPMVPTIMNRGREGDDFKKYYEPHLLVVGLHFNEKTGFDFTLSEGIKRKSAKDFLKEKSYEDVITMYDKMLKEINELRDCYELILTDRFEDEDLAWKLFVDGCFVLQYIFYNLEEAAKYVDTEEVIFMQIINQDLLLLENQLPFRVLEILMMDRESEMHRIEEFVENNIAVMLQKEGRYRQLQPWLPRSDAARRSGDQQQDRPRHLLDLLRTRLIGKVDYSTATILDRNPPPKWRFLRNVGSLMAEGINIKRRTDTDSLAAISFSSYLLNSDLSLPPLTIDEMTRPIIMNLVAMEMSRGFKSNKEITSYICLLRSLVSHPEDVRELRAAHVLSTYCATDEEVATMLNQMAAGLVPSSIHENVYKKIDDNFKGKHIPFANWINARFRGPWTVVIFSAATLGIILTFIQTIMAFVQAGQDQNGGNKQS